jgi:hypothetical protein
LQMTEWWIKTEHCKCPLSSYFIIHFPSFIRQYTTHILDNASRKQIFSLFSFFRKIKVGLWSHLANCAPPPPQQLAVRL